jgi:hypothetical protein
MSPAIPAEYQQARSFVQRLRIRVLCETRQRSTTTGSAAAGTAVQVEVLLSS